MIITSISQQNRTSQHTDYQRNTAIYYKLLNRVRNFTQQNEQIDLAEKYCDAFWLMKRGRVFEQTTILDNEKIGEMFVNL